MRKLSYLVHASLVYIILVYVIIISRDAFICINIVRL